MQEAGLIRIMFESSSDEEQVSESEVETEERVEPADANSTPAEPREDQPSEENPDATTNPDHSS